MTETIQPLPGIYAIMIIVEKQIKGVYIGQSKDIKKRWKTHRIAISNRQHTNEYLKKIQYQYGFSCFHFMVLESCPVEKLNERERYWFSEMMIYYPVINSLIPPGLPPHEMKKLKAQFYVPKPEANKQRLKNYLRERPNATIEEICFDFDLSSRTIYRYLADLGLSLASANGSAKPCAK